MLGPEHTPSPAPTAPRKRATGRPGTAYRALRAHVAVGLRLWLHGQLGLQDPLHGHVLVVRAGTLRLTLRPLPAPLPLLLDSCTEGHADVTTAQDGGGGGALPGPPRGCDRHPRVLGRDAMMLMKQQSQSYHVAQNWGVLNA